MCAVLDRGRWVVGKEVKEGGGALGQVSLRAEAATERSLMMPAICLPYLSHQVSRFVAAAAIVGAAGGAARTQIPHDAELGLRGRRRRGAWKSATESL